MKSNKIQNKIKISVIISIVSILIALLSLSFAIYKDLRDYNTDKEIKNLQIRGANFDEIYSKINLAEQNLVDSIESCEYSDELNKENVKNNLNALIEARQAVINNDNTKALIKLSEIKEVCVGEEKINKKLQDTIGLYIIVIIWVVLIISILILYYRNGKYFN